MIDTPLNGWQWAVALAVPVAILLLYFLKLRRRTVEVPSTYLWVRTLEEMHVNALWQRLRQNLLLFLQLLTAALVLLALLGISWSGARVVGKRFVILVDVSASMSATDEGTSRLDRAKREALATVEQMDSDAVAMVIAFSDRAQVVQSFTDNRAALREAIIGLRPSARRTDLREALLAASGLANPGRTASDPTDVPVPDPMPATLVLLSDGGFPVPDVALGNLTPRYFPIGSPEAQNLAITAFQVAQSPDQAGSWQAFAQVENFGSQTTTTLAQLFYNDQLLDAQQITLEAGEARALVFDLGPMDPGVLKLQLQVQDALGLDNEAWALIAQGRPARVLLLTPGNPPLQAALQTSQAQRLCRLTVKKPQFLQSSQYRQAALGGQYDLVIFDRCLPPVDGKTGHVMVPQCNCWFIAQVPQHPPWRQPGKASKPQWKELPQIIDVDDAHPLMQFVDPSGVDIVQGFPVPVPPGGQVLLEADAGPLLVVAPRDGFLDVVQGFALVQADQQGQTMVQTNWPIRASFPVFILNVLQVLGEAQLGQQAPNFRPGEVARLRFASQGAEAEVITPSGHRLPVQQQGGSLVFFQTEELGVYEVRQGEKLLGRFTVNLFDSQESNIRPRPEVQIKHQTVAGSKVRQRVRRPLWRWAVALALVVLVVEWILYNRRVYF